MSSRLSEPNTSFDTRLPGISQQRPHCRLCLHLHWERPRRNLPPNLRRHPARAQKVRDLMPHLPFNWGMSYCAKQELSRRTSKKRHFPAAGTCRPPQATLFYPACRGASIVSWPLANEGSQLLLLLFADLCCLCASFMRCKGRNRLSLFTIITPRQLGGVDTESIVFGEIWRSP